MVLKQLPKARAPHKKGAGIKDIHLPKQTWNLKMDPWKRRFLLETIISRFHVNFLGCILPKQISFWIGETHSTLKKTKAGVAGADWALWISSDPVAIWFRTTSPISIHIHPSPPKSKRGLPGPNLDSNQLSTPKTMPRPGKLGRVGKSALRQLVLLVEFCKFDQIHEIFYIP